MSRMSARTVSARRPSARIILAVSSSSSGEAGTAFDAGETGPAISTATMSAPFAASSTAIARPIPRAAPVTTATLPERFDPRPGTTGPELCDGDGSGMALPANSFGALSVCTEPSPLCARAPPAATAPVAAAAIETLAAECLISPSFRSVAEFNPTLRRAIRSAEFTRE
jgi:hypothetical protein